MQEVSKMALKNALKNCETKVAQAGFQRANQRAGFQWNGVVLLGAVLLSLLFVGNLQAQSSASTKQGFFAGIVYLQGFGVDTTKTSTSSATVYRIKYSNDKTGIDATGGNTYWPGGPTGATSTVIRALVSANCERGETSVDLNGESFFGSNGLEFFNESNGLASFESNGLDSFDFGAKPPEASIDSGDATVTSFDTDGEIFHSGYLDREKAHCYRYFSSGRTPINFSAYEIATPDTPSKPPVTSTESDSLKGVGLQVGWRGEKWRASLTHFTGKGGANELVNTVVMAEYFFHEEFFAGGGLASMKLTNGSTSASATSPVLTVGYKENLTPNLFFNISLTKYISGISISRTVSAPIPTGRTFSETQTERGDSATVGGGDGLVEFDNTRYGFNYSTGVRDSRIEVTQFRSRDVEIQEVTTPAAQKIEAEIKAPVVVSISLLWRF